MRIAARATRRRRSNGVEFAIVVVPRFAAARQMCANDSRANVAALSPRCEVLHAFRERVHPRVVVLPRIEQRRRIEFANALAESSSSSRREPAGISSRMPSWIGATFSTSSARRAPEQDRDSPPAWSTA